jgi:CCR4-NOT transcription complex subunit 3
MDIPEEDSRVSYPQVANQRLLQPEAFRGYDLSTLFYSLFFRTGRPAQLFAANELKRRGRVFHWLRGLWFRRIEEPIEMTETYEVGNYECFEVEGAVSWDARPRLAFWFEFENMA